MGTNIEDILRSWDIPTEVIEVLKEKKFDLFCLEFASDAIIQTLVPANEIGSLIRILEKRKGWIKTKTENCASNIGNASKSRNLLTESGASSSGKDESLDSQDSTDSGGVIPVSKNVTTDSDDSFVSELDERPKSRGTATVSTPKVQSITQLESSEPVLPALGKRQNGSDSKSASQLPREPPEKRQKGMIGATDYGQSSGGPDYDLKTLLSKTDKGRKVLSHYDSMGCFNTKYRDHLCQIVVEEEQKDDSGKRIGYGRFEFIADKITALFPKESKHVWIYKTVYHKGGKEKTQLSGKLYNRYYNSRRRRENIGLNDLRGPEEESLLDDAAPGTEDFDSNPDIIFLKSNNSQVMDQILKAWENTAAMRLQRLTAKAKAQKPGEEDKVTCKSYMAQFPAMVESSGLTLIQMDFKFLYPDKDMEFYNNWQKFSSFICQKIREKDPEFLKDAIYSSGEEHVRILLGVSKLFSPITIAKKNQKKGLDDWRSSRVSAQDGFLMHIENVGVLHERLQERCLKLKRYGLSDQPIPAVVGALEKPTQYLLVLDDYHYEVKSPLQAIDSGFKMYMALNAKYPHESQHIWTFVQKAVYGITTKADRKFGDVEALIHEYSNFS